MKKYKAKILGVFFLALATYLIINDIAHDLYLIYGMFVAGVALILSGDDWGKKIDEIEDAGINFIKNKSNKKEKEK